MAYQVGYFLPAIRRHYEQLYSLKYFGQDWVRGKIMALKPAARRLLLLGSN